MHALAVVLAVLDKHEQKQWEVFTGHQCLSQLTIARKIYIYIYIYIGRATADLDIFPVIIKLNTSLCEKNPFSLLFDSFRF